MRAGLADPSARVREEAVTARRGQRFRDAFDDLAHIFRERTDKRVRLAAPEHHTRAKLDVSAGAQGSGGRRARESRRRLILRFQRSLALPSSPRNAAEPDPAFDDRRAA